MSNSSMVEKVSIGFDVQNIIKLFNYVSLQPESCESKKNVLTIDNL